MHATTFSAASGPARVGRALGRIALIVGLLCAAAALLAGPAYRTEVLPLGASLQTMRWAATVAIGGTVAALLAVLLSIAPSALVRARGVAAFALLVNVLVAAPPLYMYWQLQHLPESTTSAPTPKIRQAFEAVLPLRRAHAMRSPIRPARPLNSARAIPTSGR